MAECINIYNYLLRSQYRYFIKILSNCNIHNKSLIILFNINTLFNKYSFLAYVYYK